MRLHPWLLTGLAAPLWFAAPEQRDEKQEPPPQFELRLGEARLEVAAGVPFTIEVDGKSLRGELVPRPTRRLAIEGLAFDYPEGMSYEFERFLGIDIWTLDGNDAVVMVYRYGSPVSLEEAAGFVASGLAESFRAPEESSTTLPLGAREVPGRALATDGGGFTIRSEVFLLDPDADDEGRHVLVLQDVPDDPDDPDEPSAEFVRVRQLLDETFALGKSR